MLRWSDYSSVMRNLFAAIELRGNDYSSVTRKSLHGQEIGQIGCFVGGLLVCAPSSRINSAGRGNARAGLGRKKAGPFRRRESDAFDMDRPTLSARPKAATQAHRAPRGRIPASPRLTV